MGNEKPLHSLASLEGFKALFGIDSREDKLAAFLLSSATYRIERYCMRRLVYKKITQGFDWQTANCFELLDYPVRGVAGLWSDTQFPFTDTSLIAPEHYHVSPCCSDAENVPHHLHLQPGCRVYGKYKITKIAYFAGYRLCEVPADLKSACMELAAWNYERHHQKKTGVEGGKDAALAAGMPENVRELLAAWRRVTI